jgi:putative transposase
MRKSLNFEVKEDAATLRKMLKQQKEPLLHARLLALYLYKTGQCRYRKDIAQQVGYGRNAVGRWLQTYETHGLETMLTVGASGNPREVGVPAEVVELLQKRLQDPHQGFSSYKAVRQWLSQEHDVHLSYQWVYDIVHDKMKARLKVPRKSNVKKDPKKEERFKKNAS